ncbi:hypothetical protein CF319_g7348 [Tilletia indica]|nr:hypothetical protein CF319_g7348 [Tilletia indica]
MDGANVSVRRADPELIMGGRIEDVRRTEAAHHDHRGPASSHQQASWHGQGPRRSDGSGALTEERELRDSSTEEKELRDARSAQQQAVLVSALVECQYGIASGSKRLGAGSDCDEDGVAHDGISRIALAIPNLKELPCLVGPLSKLDFPSTELSDSTWDLLVQCFHERGTGSVEEAEAYRTEVLDLATGLQRRDWPTTTVKTFVQVGLDMKDAPDGRRVLRRKSLEESKLAPPPNMVILGTFAMSTDHLWERVTGGSTCCTGEVAAHLASGSGRLSITAFMDTNFFPHPVSAKEHWDDDVALSMAALGLSEPFVLAHGYSYLLQEQTENEPF